MLGLALQDLFGQEVDNVPVIAGEAVDERGGVLSPLHRERRQLQRGDPSFGAPLQRCDIGCRQHQSHHLVEVLRGLAGRKAQIGGADLGELATPAQPGQRQRRIGAAGDHQVYLRGQMFQQEGHRVLHVARVDDVVVVEHQHDIVRDGVEVVKQSDQARLVRRLGRLQERERTCTTPGRRRIQRGDNVRPEQRGIAVALVKRKPRHGPSAGRSGSQPLRQQRRLAEPSRS